LHIHFVCAKLSAIRAASFFFRDLNNRDSTGKELLFAFVLHPAPGGLFRGAAAKAQQKAPDKVLSGAFVFLRLSLLSEKTLCAAP